MSELKAFESERIYWAVEQVEREAGDIDNLHLDDNLFYIKSEADKVISELKDKALQYKVLNEEHCRDLNTQEQFFAKQIAHQKYKRCLAMARLCNEKWLVHNFAEIPTKLGFYDKWRKRWLKIAEQFKEGK